MFFLIFTINLQAAYGEIFYPTTNVRVKGLSTYCIISNDDEKVQIKMPDWIKRVNEAVSSWEKNLKEADLENPSAWEMNVKEISQEDNSCDVSIEFNDKPDLSDTVAGYFSWPPGKIVIYYLQPKLCNVIIPCYDGKTLKSDDAIYAIAIHEIGHSLGLDHYVSDDNDLNKKWKSGKESPPSVMIPTIPLVPKVLQITDLDVQKVQEIYGPEGFVAFSNPTIPSPEPTPEPTPEPILPLTPFESMNVSEEIVETGLYGRQIITLSGKISEGQYHRGLPVIITIHKPDDSVEVLKIKTTGNGFFETLLIFDKESISGVYHISASYTEHVDKNMDVTFQVINRQIDSSTANEVAPQKSITPEKTINLSKSTIPDWIKNNAKWWATEKIGDHAFVSGIQYLIKEDIIHIPNLGEGSKTNRTMPDWVKNIAGFWAEDRITNEEFIKSIQYLVQNGMIIL